MRTSATHLIHCIATIGVLLGVGGLPVHAAENSDKSPDWREQVMYFVMLDRFADGDPSNNDQDAGEYDPTDSRKFSGGDLRGVQQRLAYIKGLGATTLWITPPVANRWWDEVAQYGGYHGYWAENFAEVDAHFGSLADYQALANALHDKQMYLVQDIVVNHTANFFTVAPGADPAQLGTQFKRHTDARGLLAPTQPPFDRNNLADARDLAAQIYHVTPDVQDYGQREQELTHQMSGLDDLNTENPVVRRALRRSYGHWIDKVGVDGYRVDTAFFVPSDFFSDFLQSSDRKAPGIARVAARTGRHDFLAFGEGFAVDAPYADKGARKIQSYQSDRKGLSSMLNFPLYGSAADVFARGAATAVLAHRIDSMQALHPPLHQMPSFVDNHDVDRFLKGGTVAGLEQALLLMFTLPGIPTIYYGTEQGFTEPRAAMFAGGYGSKGRDHFDTSAPLYQRIAGLAAHRRSTTAYTHGVVQVLRAAQAGPGALIYRARDGDAQRWVMFNSSDQKVLVDALQTDLPAGSLLTVDYALDAETSALVVGTGGLLSTELPARAGRVYRVNTNASQVAVDAAPIGLEMIKPQTVVDRDFVVRGQAARGSVVRLVLDGALERAVAVTADADGNFTATIDTASLVDPAVAHRLVAYQSAPLALSAPLTFRVEREFVLLASANDPAGDDYGRSGKLVYPTEATFQTLRPQDIRKVAVYGAGKMLRIDITMAGISQVWNPANGFDHLVLMSFIGLPNGGGCSALPAQFANAPDSMRWHYRGQVHGWSNALAACDSQRDAGTALSVAPRLSVDVAAKRLRLEFPSSLFAQLDSLSGVKIYLNTWDYDGRYRPLLANAESFAYGGRSDPDEALLMDETGIIVLP